MDYQNLRTSEVRAIQWFAEKLERRMQVDMRSLKGTDGLAVHMAWHEALDDELMKLESRGEEDTTR